MNNECPVCNGVKHKRGDIERLIVAALRSAIKDHGPIIHENTSNAAKRVIGAMKSYLKNEDSKDDCVC
jgi:Zn-finger nucleic acid-binding protein